MERDTNKIESIAVNAVEQAVNDQVLLHHEINKGDKYPFFDGEILVYTDKKQNKKNYFDRIPVQIKGREVNTFSKHDCCYFRLTRDELVAYNRESGIIFFVVEILKNPSQETKKVFLKQLLPYDIYLLFKKMKKNSVAIDLHSLENNNLTHVCQNFLRDRSRQKHGIIKPLNRIEGFDGFSISVITGDFGKGDKGLNNYIVAENPVYVYASASNDMFFPIANLIDDEVHLMLLSNEEVLVDDKSYGRQYFSQQINKDGNYWQFGLSWHFFLNGKARFSATGTLDERIKDIDFMLRVINGGKIRIGDWNFPYNPKIPPEQNLSTEKIVLCLKDLQEMKSVFEFLGATLPIEITTFRERDFRLLKALSELVIHEKECPALCKTDGFKVLRMGKYSFFVLVHQKKIINVFCRDYDIEFQTIIKMNDGTQEEISPYCYIGSEIIAKSANFNGNVVMESIKEYPYSPSVEWWYNNLLLESIKAMDIAPDNKQIVKFSNDLVDYLLEKDKDILVLRLNKMQIMKRLAPLEKNDTDWLLAERDRQDDPGTLCGIAILLDDMALFNEQFVKLTPELQEEFRTYPIMKLLDTKPIPNQDKT